MNTHTPIHPNARGRLATTSLPELLVVALERRLEGSFLFDVPHAEPSALVVHAGRVIKVRTAGAAEPIGRMLLERGAIDRGTLDTSLRLANYPQRRRLGEALLQLKALSSEVLETTLGEQLARRLASLTRLPESSAYVYYDGRDVLEDRPPCAAEPLALIWRCIREAERLGPRDEAALAGLGALPLRLHPGATPERFGLSRADEAVIDGLRHGAPALERLLELAGDNRQRARRLVYALALTGHLDRGVAPLDSVAPAPRSSAPPRAAGASRLSGRTTPAAGSIPAPDRVERALEKSARALPEERAEARVAAAGAFAEARSAVDRNQLAEASRLALEACERDPGNAEYLAFHAWLRAQLGEATNPAQVGLILAALDQAVLKERENVAVRLYRARVLKRLGRDDEAYKDFRFVARREPANLDAVREVRLHAMRSRNKQKRSGVFSRLFLR